MKRIASILLLLMGNFICFAQEEETKTTFNFGGYIKVDFLHTWYMNGDVGPTSPLRDFHFSAQIPVGDASSSTTEFAGNMNFGYEVKTSEKGAVDISAGFVYISDLSYFGMRLA